MNIIKKTKRKPKDGDIFLLSPEKGIYFYGKVLKAYVQTGSKNDWMNDSIFIVIFKCSTNNIDIKNYEPDYRNLMTNPILLTDLYWKKGYFYTIANQALTYEEKNLDIGFSDSRLKSEGWVEYFCKENGQRLDHKPEILGLYAITTEVGVATKVRQALIIEPELLELNDEYISNKHQNIDEIIYNESDLIKLDENDIDNNIELYLNLKAMPMGREYLEDILEEKMDEIDLGSIDGGGTAISENGEIDYCDISIEMSDMGEESIKNLKKILDGIDLPKGSFICVQDRKIPFGNLEGLSLEIDIKSIDKTMHLEEKLSKVMKRSGKLYDCYQTEDIIRFYYYGKDYDKMLFKLEEKLVEIGITKNYIIKKIA